MPNRRINDTTPTTTVVWFASGRLISQFHNFCHEFEPDDSVPVILKSSPDTTLMATPKTKPARTAAERNSETHPILSTHITT